MRPTVYGEEQPEPNRCCFGVCGFCLAPQVLHFDEFSVGMLDLGIPISGDREVQ